MDVGEGEGSRRPRRAASRAPLASLNGGGGGGAETGQFGRAGPESPAVSASCNFCKQRHIRCDGKTPCGQCTKRHLVCQYGVRAKTGPKPRVNPDAVYTQLSQEIQNHRHRADYWKNKFLSLKAQLETEAISLQSPSSSTSNSNSSIDTPSKRNAKSAARRAIKESRLAIWSSALATMTYLTSLVQPGGNLHSCYFEDTQVPKASEWIAKEEGDPNAQPNMVKVESDEAPSVSRLGLAMDLFEASIAPMVNDYKFKRSMESATAVWTMSVAEACKLEGGKLLSVFEHAIVLTMAFYSMQDVRCGEKYERLMESLLGVVIWARELHMLSQYADKLAQLLIHMLAFYSGAAKEGVRQTLVTLAYQVISLHRPFVSASSMHRIFMTMMTFSDNHRDRQQWMEEALRCEGPEFSEVHSFKYAFHIFYVFCSIHPRMSYETQRPNYSIKELFGFLQILEFAATKIRDQDADFTPFATAFPDLALSFHLFIHGTRAECLFLLGDHRAALRLAQWVIEAAASFENPSSIWLFAIQSSLEICFVMKQLDWVYRAVAMLNAQATKLPLAGKLNKRNQEILHIHVPTSATNSTSNSMATSASSSSDDAHDSRHHDTKGDSSMAIDTKTQGAVNSGLSSSTSSSSSGPSTASTSSASTTTGATASGTTASSSNQGNATISGTTTSLISPNGQIAPKKKTTKSWLEIANSTPPMEHVPEGLDVDSIIRRETTVVDDHPKNPLTVSNILGRSVLDGTTSDALTRQLGLTSLVAEHFPPRQQTEVDDADVRALLSIATMVDTVEDDTLNTAMRSSDWRSKRSSAETGSEMSWGSVLGISSSPSGSALKSPSGARLGSQSPTSHHLSTSTIGSPPSSSHSPQTAMALGSLSSLASSPPSSMPPSQAHRNGTGFKVPASTSHGANSHDHRNGSSTSHTPISFGPAVTPSNPVNRTSATPAAKSPQGQMAGKVPAGHANFATPGHPAAKQPAVTVASSPPHAATASLSSFPTAASTAAAMAGLSMPNTTAQPFPFTMPMSPLFGAPAPGSSNAMNLDYASMPYQQQAAAAVGGYPNLNLYMPFLGTNLLPPHLLMNYPGYAGNPLTAGLTGPLPTSLATGTGAAISGLPTGPTTVGSPLNTSLHDPSLTASLRGAVDPGLHGMGASGLLELAQRAHHMEVSHPHSIATKSPPSLALVPPSAPPGNYPQPSQNASLPRKAEREFPPISLLNGPNGADLAMSASAVTQSLEGSQYPMYGARRSHNSSSM